MTEKTKSSGRIGKYTLVAALLLTVFLITSAVGQDTTPPSISLLTPPTPVDNSKQTQDWFTVDADADDSGLGDSNVSVFIDIDNSLVGWWTMNENMQKFFDDFSTDTTGDYSWITVDSNAPVNSHNWNSGNSWVEIRTGDNDEESLQRTADLPSSGYAIIKFIKRVDYPNDNQQYLYVGQDDSNYYMFTWTGSAYTFQGVSKVVGGVTTDVSENTGTVELDDHEFTIEAWWSPTELKLAIDGSTIEEITTTDETEINPTYFNLTNFQIDMDLESIEIYDRIVVDSSPYENNGSSYGNVLQAQGYMGNALDFGTGDNYVAVGTDPEFVMDDKVTLSAWIYPEDENHQTIAGKFSSGAGYSLGITWVAALEAHTRFKINGFSIEDPANIYGMFNQWIHYVGVYNGTKMLLYRNGNLVDSADYSTPITDSWTRFNIGYRQEGGGTNYFEGMLDDIMVFGRGLSNVEVEAIYANQSSKHMQHTYSGLANDMKHEFKAYAQDTEGNINETETIDVMIGEGCGNGIFEPPFEECEDGNTMNGDGCNVSCKIDPFNLPFNVSGQLCYQDFEHLVDPDDANNGTNGYSNGYYCNYYFGLIENGDYFTIQTPPLPYAGTYLIEFDYLRGSPGQDGESFTFQCGSSIYDFPDNGEEPDIFRKKNVTCSFNAGNNLFTLSHAGPIQSVYFNNFRIYTMDMPPPTIFFQGKMDNVMIYNRALSPEEIQSHFLFPQQFTFQPIEIILALGYIY